MYAVACEGVKEYWERSHQGLTFTSGHLSNLTLVEHHATYELHIIVGHIPLNHVAACHPLVLVNGVVAVNCHKVKLGGQMTVKISG